jgi:hypothetical protein
MRASRRHFRALLGMAVAAERPHPQVRCPHRRLGRDVRCLSRPCRAARHGRPGRRIARRRAASSRPRGRCQRSCPAPAGTTRWLAERRVVVGVGDCGLKALPHAAHAAGARLDAPPCPARLSRCGTPGPPRRASRWRGPGSRPRDSEAVAWLALDHGALEAPIVGGHEQCRHSLAIVAASARERRRRHHVAAVFRTSGRGRRAPRAAMPFMTSCDAQARWSRTCYDTI